jgi:hypothetical protein
MGGNYIFTIVSNIKHTSTIPVIYDPMAKASRPKQLLNEILNGDIDQAAKISVVEEAMVCTLIPSCRLEKFFILIVSEASRKSMLLATLLDQIG